MNSVTEALKTKAYVAPFAVFMGFTLVWQFGVPLLEWDHPAAPWWRRAPEQWLYPVQAIVCFALVFRWRKAIDWDWRWKPAAWGILFGVLGILCFFRAVVVVALVEELFWRGYLMRLMVNPDHPWKVPFGTHSWKAYWVTTLCFMAVHQPVDYCGAFVYGSLAYLLAVWRKNLCAVIMMHAAANALLGWAALEWGKYGLW